MVITVKLFAYFRKERFKVKEMEFDAGTTVGQVIEYLSLPRKDVEQGTVFLNGKRSGLDTELQEKDTLSIFPPVAGG